MPTRLVDRLRSRTRPAPSPRSGGVNVVGYFGATSGLANRAHELVACLRESGIAVTEWPVPPHGETDPAAGTREVFDTTVAVVTAVELAGVQERFPEPFEQATWVGGYFFWELAEVPDEQGWGIGLVDEVWAPTTFVRDAYLQATGRPVRLVPLPIAPPPTGDRDRSAMGFDDADTVFLTSFDFFSSVERKNPLGTIDAFRRAFPGGDEPVRLVVKSINGSRRADDLARVTDAANADPRIEILDGHLDETTFADLVRAADAFVSLHRSEGLGLHIAEAMWLGTPVVATAYSGSLDLTAPGSDGDVAALVDAELVAVTGGGDAYLSGEWADPDLDVAAEAMRRMAVDPAWRVELADRAHRRMSAQFDRLAAGDHIRAALWAQ